MASANYYMMIEPAFSGTHWCEQCVQGIRQEVSRSKGILEEVPVNDLRALERVQQQERPLLMLVGSLVNWMTETVQRLGEAGIHSIMMTAPPPDGHFDASTISMDYNQAICDLLRYLSQMQRRRMALFGVHPNSINDLTKQRAYCDFMHHETTDHRGIFWNTGNVSAACERFYQQMDEFDAVLCSNDIIAIKLYDFLKEKKVEIPQRLYLVSIGETRLSQLVKPGITTASLNFFDIGHNAVRLYNILRRNDTITALHAKVRGTITVRESTGNVPYQSVARRITPPQMPEQSSFYADDDVRRIFMLENLVSHCLPIDFAILRSLMLGQPYRQMAEEHYTSENSIKYRIKRMMELAQCETKEQMIRLVSLQLRVEDLPKS